MCLSEIQIRISETIEIYSPDSDSEEEVSIPWGSQLDKVDNWENSIFLVVDWRGIEYPLLASRIIERDYRDLLTWIP